jgi:hypothetical protein
MEFFLKPMSAKWRGLAVWLFQTQEYLFEPARRRGRKPNFFTAKTRRHPASQDSATTPVNGASGIPKERNKEKRFDFVALCAVVTLW